MIRLEIETYFDPAIQSEALKNLAHAYQCLQEIQHPQAQAWSKNAAPDTLAFLKSFYTDIASSPSAAYRHTVMSPIDDIARSFEPNYTVRKNVFHVDIKTGPNIVIHCGSALAAKIQNAAGHFPGVKRVFPTHAARGPSPHP